MKIFVILAVLSGLVATGPTGGPTLVERQVSVSDPDIPSEGVEGNPCGIGKQVSPEMNSGGSCRVTCQKGFLQYFAKRPDDTACGVIPGQTCQAGICV